MNDNKKNEQFSLQIDFERLKLLLQHGPIAICSSMLISMIAAVMLWSENISHEPLYAWVSFVFFVAALRLLYIKKIKEKLLNTQKTLHSQPIEKYLYFYAVGSFFYGLSLGSISLIMDPSSSLLAQLIIPLLIVGLVAGALSANASSSLTYGTFIISLTLPSIICFYLNGMILISGLLIFYVAVMLTISKQLNIVITESFNLRHYNIELNKNLIKKTSEEAKLLEQLRDNEHLISGAFNNSGVAMGLIDCEMIIFKVNEKASELFGIDAKEMVGMSLLAFSQKEEKEHSEKLFTELVAGESIQYELRERYVHKSGTSLWVQIIVSSVLESDGAFNYAIFYAQDISQEQQLTDRLTHQARHDPLTDLPNRYAFESRLESLLQKNNGDEHVLCYIDLDQFKVVNDTCGHIAGDELLRQLSRLLLTSLRKADLLARIGGDEFAVLMFHCSMEAAEKQLEIVLSKVREFHFIYDDQRFNVGASLGLVAIDSNSTMTEVLKQADSACYAAKEAGRDRLHIYTHDDEVLSQRSGEMQWVSKIQHALANDMLVLYYQEIVQIDGNGKRPHYELLIRMKDEEGNTIPPGLFLPAAERYNLAAAIDMWVVEHVMTTLNAAYMEGKEISGVYGINISGRSLSDTRFYEHIIQWIRDNDLRQHDAYICFEITETAAVSNMTAALHFISELRSVGCQFALDDFGSGLSSFAYLKQMPIDYLKIDGMFVKDCLTDPVNLEMIDSINGIGHVMKLKTIAEFVENDEIFNKLGELGVDYAQGYWNGSPQPWLIEKPEWEIEAN